MSEEKKSKGGVWQFIKFALFSASAGIIQGEVHCKVFTELCKVRIFCWFDFLFCNITLFHRFRIIQKRIYYLF